METHRGRFQHCPYVIAVDNAIQKDNIQRHQNNHIENHQDSYYDKHQIQCLFLPCSHVVWHQCMEHFVSHTEVTLTGFVFNKKPSERRDTLISTCVVNSEQHYGYIGSEHVISTQNNSRTLIIQCWNSRRKLLSPWQMRHSVSDHQIRNEDHVISAIEC